MLSANVTFLQKIPNKRGPPVLQNRSQRKGNASETVSEDTAADKDRPEGGVIR